MLNALPINPLPCLGTMLIGIGIASRDGLAVLCGVAVGVADTIASIGLIYGGWQVANSLLGGV